MLSISLLDVSDCLRNKNTSLQPFIIGCRLVILASGEILEEFDRVVFESVIKKIIIGGYNNDGVKDPLVRTFVPQKFANISTVFINRKIE